MSGPTSRGCFGKPSGFRSTERLHLSILWCSVWIQRWTWGPLGKQRACWIEAGGQCVSQAPEISNNERFSFSYTDRKPTNTVLTHSYTTRKKNPLNKQKMSRHYFWLLSSSMPFSRPHSASSTSHFIPLFSPPSPAIVLCCVVNTGVEVKLTKLIQRQ